MKTYMNSTSPYFALLRYCLGKKRNMSRVIAGMNWQELYSFASKQALLGLCFDGIERLGKEYRKYSFTFAPGITKAKVG